MNAERDCRTNATGGKSTVPLQEEGRLCDRADQEDGSRLIPIGRSSSTCSEDSADDKLVLVSLPDEAAFHMWADSPESQETSKDRKAGDAGRRSAGEALHRGLAESGGYHPHRGPNPNPIPKPSGNVAGAK
jgi:uncharacterized protein (DUF1330 family)